MRRALSVPFAVVAVAAGAHTAGAAGLASCGSGTPTYAFGGSFDPSLQGSYVDIPFNVAEGTTKVRLRICYDQPPTPLNSQVRDTLDLGMYDHRSPDGTFGREGFRGWGGSSRPDQYVSPHQATVGFTPGPIPAGEWAAEMGLAAIPAITDGDPDGVAWRLEVFLTNDPADAADPWTPVPYDETPRIAKPGWYAGDFHVHAINSNPNDAPDAEVFNYAFADRLSGGAGLDFITLSDYVGTRQWDEIGAYEAQFPDKLIIRSAEVITYRGHVNNHGSHTYVDYRTGPIAELRSDGSLEPVRAAQQARRIFDDIHAAGGWTQVNHPTIFPSKVPAFAYQCRGCSWEYTDADTDWAKVDAFEVHTGPAGMPGQTGTEPGPNPFTPEAIAWWDSLRAAGYRVTAVASSDSHKAGRPVDLTKSPGDITRSPIGEGTTVVYADELSEAGIQDGVRAGHAYVKLFGNNGPDLRFTAIAGAQHAMMGDVVHAATADFTAEVIGGAPSYQPHTLVVLFNGVPIVHVPVPNSDFTFSFPGALAGDYRLQLQRGSAIEALTNPITLTGRSSRR